MEMIMWEQKGYQIRVPAFDPEHPFTTVLEGTIFYPTGNPEIGMGEKRVCVLLSTDMHQVLLLMQHATGCAEKNHESMREQCLAWQALARQAIGETMIRALLFPEDRTEQWIVGWSEREMAPCITRVLRKVA